jgi:hypothetical protein
LGLRAWLFQRAALALAPGLLSGLWLRAVTALTSDWRAGVFVPGPHPLKPILKIRKPLFCYKKLRFLQQKSEFSDF